MENTALITLNWYTRDIASEKLTLTDALGVGVGYMQHIIRRDPVANAVKNFVSDRLVCFVSGYN